MRSDYVYKDRKMMKWIPFNALLEQGDHISKLLYGREEKAMPLLSVDQLEELNYQLETAYIFQSEIIVTYFEKDDFKTAQGIISRTDNHNKIIFVNEEAVYAKTITNIETI